MNGSEHYALQKGMDSKDANSPEKCQFSLSKPGINVLRNNTRHLIAKSQFDSSSISQRFARRKTSICHSFIISEARCT